MTYIIESIKVVMYTNRQRLEVLVWNKKVE